ncbi:hypothetical protein WMO64_01315, partial [Pseudoflavonifractor sp. CLA-AP-H29]
MALFICHWGAHFLSTICYIFILPKTTLSMDKWGFFKIFHRFLTQTGHLRKIKAKSLLSSCFFHVESNGSGDCTGI